MQFKVNGEVQGIVEVEGSLTLHIDGLVTASVRDNEMVIAYDPDYDLNFASVSCARPVTSLIIEQNIKSNKTIIRIA